MSTLQQDLIHLRSQNLQKVYNWEVVMPHMLTASGENVSRLVQAISYKDYAMGEPLGIREGAYQSFYVNHLSIPPFTITFLEDEKGTVQSYFASWKSRMVNRKGLWSPKIGGYAWYIILRYLNSSGEVVRQIKFFNVFPLKFYEADLDYRRNEVLRIEVSFSADWIESV